MAVGRVVLVSGVLVLLFIPFLLWGTGLITARSQAALRAQFGIDQHRSGSLSTKHLSAPKQTTAAPAPLQVAPVIADPAVGSPVGTIYIPKIALSMVVVEGTDEPQLQLGPGHYPSTPLPGEAGNSAIAGHRTTYLAPFYNLDALVPGDTILVTTVQGTFLYQMTGNQVVDPSDVSVVAATSTPQLTLTTCNPRYSASQRLVVHAALVASALTHPNVVPVRTADVHRVTVHHPPAPTAPAKNWTAAILWGLAVAALSVAIWLATRRTHGGRRALVIAAGGLAWLVVVFSFFTMVAPLLPASY
jgi:sortase A